MHRLMWSVMLILVTVACRASDMPALRPAVRWLETERLRGVLFHDPTYGPLRPFYLQAGEETADSSGGSLTLVGESYFLLLPGDDRRVGAQVEAVSGCEAYPETLYALFDEMGRQLTAGIVPPGQARWVGAGGVTGVCTLLVNSGPGMRNTARVTPRAQSWCLYGGDRRVFDESPLHLHFLRDLKLGGFNLAMVDFLSLPDDFLTDEGLSQWTGKVKAWADYARGVKLRIMPSVDLGGSEAEVRAWAGCRPGLYIEHFNNLPLAPCPLDRRYWEQLYLVRGRAVARLSRDNPYIVGYGLDPEMYMAWNYGHYMLSGTCFCDHCLGGFLQTRGLPREILTELTTGKERHEWLNTQRLYGDYDKYLEDEMAKIATWCRDELHAINPDLLTNMFVTEIGNWFCRGIARGFGKPGLPTLNFAEHTYYGVGYDPQWLAHIIKAYRDWGAQVVQGSAMWNLYFPATEPRFFAAHAYNLITRGQGYWYWPGDDLYRDWGCRDAFFGKPAWHDDFWPAAVWAHREADRWLRDRRHVSPLDRWEPVPWKGKRDNEAGKWTTEASVAQSYPVRAYPVHVLAPAILWFRAPERPVDITLSARVRTVGGRARVRLRGPAGDPAAQVTVTDLRDETMSVVAAPPGLWCIEVAPLWPRQRPEVMVALEGPRAFLAPSPDVLPEAITKPAGLIGWWKLDEGHGDRIADSSPPPLFDGTVSRARWVPGVRGSALAFDGRSGEGSIPLDDPFHGMRRFTLCAWVKLNSLSVPGNGRTILNKGPEAPVQHFWWWIGYPPDYALVLELGNEKHRWGTSLSTGPLTWELGRWYHVAVTFESAHGVCTARHYRDGVLVGTAQREDDLHSGSYDLRIGSYGGLHWMDGAIDEVKIFDTVLSPQEVATEARP